ncbi:MAG: ABC transporter ATP-binding protein [Clostridia bacterium]|nr:ABC transporter ATP-binding protein [Clostridia bacterium]
MDSIISVKNLSLSYGDKNILSNVSFELESGYAAALIGENGSGKSTLLTALAGIVKPHSGDININGKIAYLPQEISLVDDLTFNDNLKFFASLARCKVPRELPMGADALRKIRIKKMSGGMKKLCSIVCTLLADADIYMFDEPCAALDKEHREMFISHVESLVKQGKTVLYVAHDKSEYESFANIELCVEESSVTVNMIKCEANV